MPKGTIASPAPLCCAPPCRYVLDSQITIVLQKPANNVTTTTQAVGLCITFSNHLPTFDTVVNSQVASVETVPPEFTSYQGTYTYTRASFTITFNRTKSTRFFSIFIVILMWLLSGMVLALSIDHTFIRPCEPVPPTIGFVVSMLFALPAVRNTQPEMPPIGVAVDVLGELRLPSSSC
jgi:hypothetical protein